MAKTNLALIAILLCVISSVLTILTFLISNWTYHERGESEYEFGLFECTNCPENEEGMSWDCYSKYFCEREDEAKDSATED
ncbi:MAG: hypothetical protein V2I33_20205 [Kangiellaceae bacterium]|jgi:hypothetical protein|nr:hypothetical protein [Kangiellaceae bacterium]